MRLFKLLYKIRILKEIALLFLPPVLVYVVSQGAFDTPCASCPNEVSRNTGV